MLCILYHLSSTAYILKSELVDPPFRALYLHVTLHPHTHANIHTYTKVHLPFPPPPLGMCSLAGGRWDGDGGLLFTSSSALYDVDGAQPCNEVTNLSLYRGKHVDKLPRDHNITMMTLMNFTSTVPTNIIITILKITPKFAIIVKT